MSMSEKLLKRIGISLLIIPIVFLSLFLFGEVLSGDISGLSHLLQIIPFFILVYISWRWPFWGGALLVLLSVTFGVLYAIDQIFSWQTVLLVELVLFLPPFVSGVLLILSSKKK